MAIGGERKQFVYVVCAKLTYNGALSKCVWLWHFYMYVTFVVACATEWTHMRVTVCIWAYVCKQQQSKWFLFLFQIIIQYTCFCYSLLFNGFFWQFFEETIEERMHFHGKHIHMEWNIWISTKSNGSRKIQIFSSCGTHPRRSIHTPRERDNMVRPQSQLD